jgi:hypothetical protein
VRGAWLRCISGPKRKPRARSLFAIQARRHDPTHYCSQIAHALWGPHRRHPCLLSPLPHMLWRSFACAMIRATQRPPPDRQYRRVFTGPYHLRSRCGWHRRGPRVGAAERAPSGLKHGARTPLYLSRRNRSEPRGVADDRTRTGLLGKEKSPGGKLPGFRFQ